MDYVNEESLGLVKEMTRKFQVLPASAGVLFVGVKAVPVADGACKTFEVRLGVTETIGEQTGRSLIRHVLFEEIDHGYVILASVYPGVSGAAHAAGHEEARKHQA
jgi:hypothetical protein